MTSRLDRSRYELEFDGALEESWIPHYLPPWSSRAASAARVSFDPLELRIDEDQQPWSPEYDGALRVSSLQTGVRSGPVGSASGQHPFRSDLVVREQQLEQRIFTPHHGLIETTFAALTDDFARVPVSVDTREPHTYSAEWLPEGVRFSVDDDLVFSTPQSPDYPMQLMLSLYEFEPAGDCPRRFAVPSVRGYRAR